MRTSVLVILYFLGVPNRKGIVIPNGEENGTCVFLARIEICLSGRIGRKTIRPVVIVPILKRHDRAVPQVK